MSVPLSQVKAVCTAAEFDLVQQSRRPRLPKLDLTAARQCAQRARGLFDKWQGQERQQGRTQAKQGVGTDAAQRTRLKTQIFRDALHAFEAHVTKLTKSKASSIGSTGKSKAARSKPARATQHRTTRAKVRQELAQTSVAANAPSALAAQSDKSPAMPTPAPAKAAQPAAAPPAATPVARPKKSKSALRGVEHSAGGLGHAASQRQLKANAKAVENRIAASGKTTHVRGHVAARGRRKQARRDGN